MAFVAKYKSICGNPRCFHEIKPGDKVDMRNGKAWHINCITSFNLNRPR